MGREFVSAQKQDRAFEDFVLGDVVVTDARTIEMSDINAFAGLTGDFFALHVDEEYAKATPFGGRIAHGPLTFSISSGLMYLAGYYGTAIQNMLECRDMRALKPVRPGDTLRVRAEVVGLDEWKRPHLGVLTVRYSVLNQRDEEVMTYNMVMLAKRRNAEARNG